MLYSKLCSRARKIALYRVSIWTMFPKVNPLAKVPIVEQYVVVDAKPVSTEIGLLSIAQECPITDVDLSSFFSILGRSVGERYPWLPVLDSP